MSKTKEIVLGVTGSIAAYKAAEIISRLRREKIELTVVMTKEAEEFITPRTLQILSGNKVISDLFAELKQVDPAHITLAQRADLVLIAPATANIIAKLSAGIADDVLTCLCLAASSPIVICPAMNEKMFEHPITQENIARLKKVGYHFIGPKKGRLACGDYGLGCLTDVQTIVQETVKLLK